MNEKYEEAELVSRNSELLSEVDMKGDIVTDRETAKMPERNLEHLNSLLKSLSVGDRIKIEIGMGQMSVTYNTTISDIKPARNKNPPHVGWEYTIEFPGPEGNNKVGRLYRIGIGSEDYEPWSVFSYSFYKEIGLLEKESEGFHGWILSATKL